MRKTVVALAVFLLIITALIIFFGRDWVAGPQKATGSERLIVITGTPVIQNITEIIGGEQVEVASIITGASCGHQYEPGPGDAVKAVQGALIIKAGMGVDPWMDDLAKISGGAPNIIDASQGVEPLLEEDPDGHAPAVVNPHYWGSPFNIRIVAANIFRGLCRARPGETAYFNRNYQSFLAKLNRVAVTLKQRTAILPRRELVSFADSFPYFFAYFGFINLATVEASCEQEVSPRRLAHVARLIKMRQIKVVVATVADEKVAANLARETGAKLVLLWSGTDLSGDYITTLQENIRRLENAFHE